MSDPHHESKKTPVQKAIEEGLTKFVTLFLEGRIKYVEKLNKAIDGETDVEKLKVLREALNDSYLSEKEIESWEVKATKMLTALDKISDIFVKIKTKMRSIHEGHHHH